MSDFTQLVKEFKLSVNNPLIKDAVKQPFEELWVEQSIPFNGPKAHDKFRKRLRHLTKFCDNKEVLKAYNTIWTTYNAVMDYMYVHF
jgi:hypothetical protein